MGKKIYIGNLALSITQETLKEIFTPYGSVLNAKITLDRHGKSQGFAFVEMKTEAEAAAAISKLHGSTHANQVLTVNAAKPAAKRDQRRTLANRRNRGRSS